MNKMMLWFWLSCKRQVKRPFFLLLLLFLPAGIWGISRAEENASDKIAIALYADGDPWNMQLAEELRKEDTAFRFYICDSEEVLKEDVMSEDAECGYMLTKGLKTKLDTGKQRRSITMVTSPSTIVGKLATEKVFAGLFRIYGRDILEQYSREGQPFLNLSKRNVWGELEPIYDWHLDNGSTFSFRYETITGGEVKKDTVKAAFPIRGIVAVFVFVMGMAAAVTAGEDEKNGLFAAVAVERKKSYMLVQIGAAVFLAGASALLALTVSNSLESWWKEAIAMLTYAIITVFFSYAGIRIFKNPLVTAGFIPFFIIISLVACPVFIDLSVYVPFLKTVRLFLPPYYYLIM